MKKKTTGNKKQQTRDYPEIQDRITELDTELITLEARVKEMGNEIDEKRRRWLAETLRDSGQFFQATLNSMLHDIFDFMKTAPIWEVMEVRDVGVLGASSKQILDPLYKKGWRMLGFAYDEKKGERIGITLHRPKPPATFEEFRSLYEDFLLGKTAPQKRTVKAAKERPVKKVARKRSVKSK